MAFHAHEVLEAAWKAGPEDERPLWQGLAQLAVGITHIQRGNTTGALALLRRGAENIPQVAGYGVDVSGLRAHADGLISDLAVGRDIAEERLTLRLRLAGDSESG